ncbi:2-oxoglutarate (2OG) and Fe(II)-dependent oxygenase superfamily protein [Striga asiatica]|uniref:2-oxoglutarate (2OG) and Fe(II)-dependent oxygenase superfamily protein n=1 Tax=Striga asiatica TaxID=4170 RepID=A0A5A7QZ97_STRAF|nr:2-oxoglutarate (2OG) and Fe(II)-dependent oxygenase superfamily protein [Striga asiatica]
MGLEVDPAFIQAPEHRPEPESIEADNIPLIDLSPLSSPEPDPAALRQLIDAIGGACENWGFFQVVNHGVPPDSLRRIESAARDFFALPKEEKRKVARDEVNPTGYYDTEHTKNVRDWKEVFDFTVQVPTVIPANHVPGDEGLKEMVNHWPEYPPKMRKICEEHAAEIQKLAFKLLELISLSLGLAQDRLNGFLKDQTSFIRLNHYPPCPISDLALGVGRHKDAGALTILAQDDVGGLQVKRKSDGQWVLVKPTPDAYIINVGDIIQVWSNDKYESVEHRVKVNSEKERLSIPFFFNPAFYTMVKPLAELLNDQSPGKYRAYNWGRFFTTRKLSNFKKLDVENIQIHHFKN